ncbi:hypothetical protein CAEBREN_23695 [Caenorhabditis brenneri]|uniref:Uncharacterized protein n=1 Tax=Caenorhabditis brenneri TaxID=135651 RepID=G0MIZ3_CAEBE|nr:hypothetical protein CAEBREN_23695 [Caenorhabditis brenneri]
MKNDTADQNQPFVLKSTVGFGSIMMQIFGIFYALFTISSFDGMATTHVVLMTLCIFAIFTFLIGVQVFCSAAMLKLGGVPPLSKPVKKSRRHHKKRSEKVKNEESSTKSNEKSGISTMTSDRGSVPTMTPSCSHDHTCSTFGEGNSTKSS